MKTTIHTIVLLGLFLCLSFNSHAQLTIGDVATDFSLQGTDSSMVSMANYPEAKGFVVIFMSHSCPYTKFYLDRIKNLQATYADQGIQFIAINANSTTKRVGEGMRFMRKFVKEKEILFPYVKDKTQAVAKSFGAMRNPEAILLDPTFKVVYRGTIDDNPRRQDDVEDAFLQQAIDQYLKKEEISIPETKPVGTSIVWH